MSKEVNEKEVFMDIYCLHCKEETPHKVIYGPKFLKEMRCEVCGTVLRVDRKQMLKTYAAEFVDRVLTKPYRMKKELRGKELIESSTGLRKAADMLLAGIADISPVVFTGAKPRMVAFVGPTGSGKTTTIAKLAADFTLNMNKDVSVLTIDTRRVDAVGQLKAYCRILNIPLHIAYTPEELPVIMPGIIKSDITLVDTPGSGPMDKQHMLEMVEFLQKMVPQEVHLVMSVTTSFIAIVLVPMDHLPMDHVLPIYHLSRVAYLSSLCPNRTPNAYQLPRPDHAAYGGTI